MRPIVVWAPAYANCSAGIRACYRLVEDIRAHGYAARIHRADHPAPPPSGDVFIYPEIYGGDPGRGAGVVRWLLGPEKYKPSSDDLVFAWPGSSDDPSVPQLCVNVIELDLFKPKTSAGSGIVGWVGKGIANADFAPRWLGYSDPSTRAGLAARLSGASMLVSCDGRSAMNLEATMVGTPVRLFGARPAFSPLFPSSGIACSDAELPDAAAAVGSGRPYTAYRDVTLPAIAPDVPRMLASIESRFG